MWNPWSGECLGTLRGHTRSARHRRPVKPCVDCSPTPRRAQVWCVAALPDGHVVSGSRDDKLKVWDASSGRRLRTLTGHTGAARRRRPVDTTRRLLVDAATGTGSERRCPFERQHRVRVGRQHAQSVGRVERTVPPDAARAHGLRATPASSQTARRSLVDAATGAGHVCRRPPERPRRVRLVGQHAQGVGRVARSARPDATRARGLSAAPASSRTARLMLVDTVTGAGLLRRRPAERPRRVRVGRPHAHGVERRDRRVPPDMARAHGVLELPVRAAPASRRTKAPIARRRL